MTLASEDGSRSLKKPYVQGEVVSLPNLRWRMFLLSWSFVLSSVFFVLLLSDNFDPSRSTAMTTTTTTSTTSSSISAVTTTPSATTTTTAAAITTKATKFTPKARTVMVATTETTKSAAATMLLPLIRAAVVDAPSTITSTSTVPCCTSGSASAVHIPHNPWIPSGYLEDYTYNSVARSGSCLHRTATGSAAVGPVIVPRDELLSPPGARSGNCSSFSTSGVEGVNNNNNDQCLDDDHYRLGNASSEFAGTEERRSGASAVRSVCVAAGTAERARLLRRSRLGFCDRFTLARVLGEPALEQLIRANATECSAVFERLRRLDERARLIFCEFDEILTRYDCLQKYSIRWSCNDCTGAYKAWVCSMLIPFHEGANHVKPCRDVCHTVEKKCPYFLPDTRLQYAGEPTFLCIDHDIPETVTVSPNSSYGEPPHCYLRCHQDADFNRRRFRRPQPPHSELNPQSHPDASTVRNPVQEECHSLRPTTWDDSTSSSSTSSSSSSSASSSRRTENVTSIASSASTLTSFASRDRGRWRGRRHTTFPPHHPYPYVVALLTLGILRLTRTFLTPPPFCLGLT